MASRPTRNWHSAHAERMTFGARMADKVASGMGSWTFIIIQSVFILVWVSLNLIAWVERFDPYPFILLNLLFSVQAAYAAPIIMQSQNRQSQRDREQAQNDYDTNTAAKREIEELMVRLIAIETSKIDKILRHLGIADDAPTTVKR
jgi:uncharacterized membrane protein